jgi:hypothetical protein
MDGSRYDVVKTVMREVITPSKTGIAFANMPFAIDIDPHVVFEIAMMKRVAEIDESGYPTGRRENEKHRDSRSIVSRGFE